MSGSGIGSWHQTRLPPKKKECLELVPTVTAKGGLREGQEIWKSLPLPTSQLSLMLLGQVSWQCTGNYQSLSSQVKKWSFLGSCEYPTCWAEGEAGKCHPPTLSPAETAPSNLHPSATPPAAGKSFKMLPLFWVSEAPSENVCPPQVAGVFNSQNAPTLAGVPAPLITISQCNVDSFS